MAKTAGNARSERSLEARLPGRVKALRKALGLTAAELDRQTGACAGTTGRLERGDQRIYASHLFRIAQATGVDVGWFYREDGDAPDDASGMELEKQRLLDAYMRIRDDGLKRDVFELVETLAKSRDT